MFYQSLVSTHNVWLEGICLTKIKINKRRQMTNSFYCGQLGFIGIMSFILVLILVLRTSFILVYYQSLKLSLYTLNVVGRNGVMKNSPTSFEC